MPHPHLGAQDPEQKSSPIAAETDEVTQLLRQEIPADAGCYFNDEAFEQNALVQSGSPMAKRGGIWVPIGSVDTDNP